MTLRYRLAAVFTAMAAILVSSGACAAELTHDAAPSATLGRPLAFTVFLPDGYANATQPFPVVYLLHGAGGDENNWNEKGGLFVTMTALIARGALRPTIVVMPSVSSDSWWIDGAQAKAESAIMRDLLPYVEGKYKVTQERKSRSVAGLSMGGFGALNFSLKYPEKFCAAALLSPAIYGAVPPLASAARKSPQFIRNGQFDAAFWQSQSYPAHLAHYKSGAVRVPMWILSGDHDSLGIALTSAQLYAQLLEIQPNQAELRIVDGGHEWLVWRDGLPDALQYMEKQCLKL